MAAQQHVHPRACQILPCTFLGRGRGLGVSFLMTSGSQPLTSFTRVRLTLLVGAVLMQPSTVNMKVTHIQFSFKFWCIQISVTMIPVLGETLIWVSLVLVRASVFSPLFILCSTCGQREFKRSL
ncbi:hypothetical protein BDR06DRAFT_955661 [Suillus hirtellus]|nr:hypothetical protein BDR06DRAFT_955661 [Suillus hirtellus]